MTVRTFFKWFAGLMMMSCLIVWVATLTHPILPDSPVPSKLFTAINPATVPTGTDLDLSKFGFANMRYLVQPSDQPMNSAFERLMQGQGLLQVNDVDRTLPVGADMERGTSTYFFGKVATKAGDRPVFVYDVSYGARRLTLWLWDAEHRAFTLCAQGGMDIPFLNQCAPASYPWPEVSRSIWALPDGAGVQYFLFRADSTEPQESPVVRDEHRPLVSFYYTNLIDASNCGWAAATLAAAIYYTFRSRRKSYVLLIGAAITWLVFLMFIDGLLPWLTAPGATFRIAKNGLYYVYFLFYIAGISILTIEISEVSGTRISRTTAGILLITLGLYCLATVLKIAEIFCHTRAFDAISGYFYVYSVVILGVSLFGAVVFEYVKNRTKNLGWIVFSPLFLILSGAANLFQLYVETSNSVSLIAAAVQTWCVSLEIFFWAIAINMHHEYLEKIARNTFAGDVEKRAQELADSREALRRANRELDGGYAALHRANSSLLFIVGTYVHAVKGLLSRLSIKTMAVSKTVPNSPLTSEVPELIEQLSTQLDLVDRSANITLSQDLPLTHIGEAVRRVLDDFRGAMQLRGLELRTTIDPVLSNLQTYGYPLNQACVELLTNVLRYADTGQPVIVAVSKDRGWIRISVDNAISPNAQPNIADLNDGRRVAPSTWTRTEEISSGTGLAGISALLRHIGGRTEFALLENQLFRASVMLPVISATNISATNKATQLNSSSVSEFSVATDQN